MHWTGTRQTLDLPLADTGECCRPRCCMPTFPQVLGGSRVQSSLCTVQERPSSLQGLFTSPVNKTACLCACKMLDEPSDSIQIDAGVANMTVCKYMSKIKKQ